MNTVRATTMPATQPSKNPTLAPLAFGDNSIRMAAMIGIGLIMIPSASGRMSPITSPTRNSRCGSRPRAVLRRARRTAA